MNAVNATSCCCNQVPVGPCDPKDTYGPLTICITDNAGGDWKCETKWTGQCNCAINSDADCPNPPAIPPSYAEGCSVTYDYYRCECPFQGGVCRRVIHTGVRKKEGCYALPFLTQGQYSTGGYYITPAGQPTTLPATIVGITIEWGVSDAGRLAWDKQTFGDCEQCEQHTLIPADPLEQGVPSRVRFNGPPYMTIGPAVWTIRKQTSGSVASRWEITATQFIIRNTSGTIVYSIALAGQTIGTLFTAIDTQTAAPVVLVKQYLASGTYNADSLPATTLEARALSPVFSGLTTQMVRAFVLPTGETRKMPFPTVVPAPSLLGSLPNPWSAMNWTQYVILSGQPFASTVVSFAAFAEDIGSYSEETEAAFCSGYAESWDWDWIDDRYIFNCSQAPFPGESWAGCPNLGGFDYTTGEGCLGCPLGVDIIPCSPLGGFAFEPVSPLKRLFVLNGQGPILVTDEDLCSATYGTVKDSWVCDPFESEADCCCPEINGNDCSSGFRTFSGCYAATSSLGTWSEYLFTISR